MQDEKFDKKTWLLNHTFYSEDEIKQLDTETLVRLLKHMDWEQQQMAALELHARNDARAFEVLMDVSRLNDDDVEQVKIKTALARLQELRVKVEVTENDYKLLVPHNLDIAGYIEVGYVMAQLTDIPFPEDYAPINEKTSRIFYPRNKNPNVEFRESYPAYMKFLVHRRRQKSNLAQSG